MAKSNYTGNLLLTTGNKSEMATGYCTLYGDMAGGFASISDVPKTMVYRLCELINRDNEVIPQAILDKPPSAELRPNQKDSDSLPDYGVLDQIIEGHILHSKDHDALEREGFDPELIDWILRLIQMNEYKRRQAPPGIKLTAKAFGSGRRMPLAQRWNP
jgi:NAD+ synthetase